MGDTVRMGAAVGTVLRVLAEGTPNPDLLIRWNDGTRSATAARNVVLEEVSAPPAKPAAPVAPPVPAKPGK